MPKGSAEIMAEKQLNMRLSEETRAMFDELVKSSGMTQAEYFASLLQGAKTEELKALVPDSAEEIDELDEKLARVRELYMMAVKRSTEAYEVASFKVKGQLEQLAAAMEENKQLKALKAENERLEQELAEAQKKAAEAMAEAQAKAAEADDLRKQLTEMREQLLKLREQHADEMAEERKAHQDELIASIVRVMQEHTKKD